MKVAALLAALALPHLLLTEPLGLSLRSACSRCPGYLEDVVPSPREVAALSGPCLLVLAHDNFLGLRLIVAHSPEVVVQGGFIRRLKMTR